ncbi:hypothetical protein Aperf_G00000025614 [Anoplocephala perfoliata]
MLAEVMKRITRLSKIELKLVQVQVYFRHGARTPLHYIKSSLAQAEWTPETTKDIPETLIPMQHIDIFKRIPVDEKTVDVIYKPIKLPGQRDLYNLGARMRKLYAGEVGLLSNPPKLNEIETRSTRVGRNLKSVRSFVAGLSNGNIDGILLVPSMKFEEDVLFPNPTLNNDVKAFKEGTAELKSDGDIIALKKKIREALKVEKLVDELDNDPNKNSEDCQIYYVRDDYIARKYSGFDIPQGLQDLEKEMDHYSAIELLNELLGKRKDWNSKLDINIGPVIHLILSKMYSYESVPPLQLVAVHDSTILPMLLALDSCDEVWPPFGADITFELYIQSLGPAYQLSSNGSIPAAAPNSNFDWSAIMVDQMWVRVLYLGRPLPLLSTWFKGDETIRQMTGSTDYVPLMEFVRKMTPISLSIPDYRAKCQAIAEMLRAENIHEKSRPHKGPKNISAKSILAIHVDSPNILDIFVQLIFQKAANEPNFTYLYSQLCVILCERSHNFESENNCSTFKLLLLKRCENEFFNRHSIDFTNPVARQRSIGAVRFIAYLGVDKAVPDRILHDCVKTLLLCKSTTKSPLPPTQIPLSSTQDTSPYPKENEQIALDMECLCEFMKIAGSYLDTPKAHNLMDQYFGRMSQILERASPDRLCEWRSGNPKAKFVPLSTRIRYLITDVMDLRKNKWKALFEGQLNDCQYPWRAADLLKEYDRALTNDRHCSSPAVHSSVFGSALEQNSSESGTGSTSSSSDWTTLNQMGKALCSRRGNKDLDLFRSSTSVDVPSNGAFTNSSPSGNHRGHRDRDHSSGYGSGNSSVWSRKNMGTQERRGTPLSRSRRSPASKEVYSSVSKVLGSSNNASLLEKSASLASNDSLRSTGSAATTVGESVSSCVSSAAVTPATASPDIDAMMTGRTDVRQLHSSGGASPGIWRPSRYQAMQMRHPPPPPPPPPPAIIMYAEKPVHVDENKEAAKSAIGILSKTESIQEAIDQLAEKDLLTKLNKEVILKCMLLLCDDSSKPTSIAVDLNNKRSACQFASLLLHESKPRGPFAQILESTWPLMLQRLSAAASKTAPAFLAARLALVNQISLAKLAEPLKAGRHHPLFLLILQQLGQMADSSSVSGAFLSIEGDEKEIDDGQFIPEGVDFKGDQNERRKKLMNMFTESGLVLEEILPGEVSLDLATHFPKVMRTNFLILAIKFRLSEDVSRLSLEKLTHMKCRGTLFLSSSCVKTLMPLLTNSSYHQDSAHMNHFKVIAALLLIIAAAATVMVLFLAIKVFIPGTRHHDGSNVYN